MDVRTVNPNSDGYFYVDGQAGHVLVRHRANKLLLDRFTGAPVYDQNASALPVYWRLSDTADPLHFGDFGGLPTKLIWFVFGAGLSGLALTGTYLHVKRLERDKNGRAHWPGTLSAVAATYILIGASMAEGWGFVKRLGPMVDGVRHWPQAPFGVIVIIVLWSLLTLFILAVWTLLVVKHQPVQLMAIVNKIPLIANKAKRRS